MQNYILYIASFLGEAYECAYSILKYLGVYNLKPPSNHTVIIYTDHPELLEAYESFFKRFELKQIPKNKTKQDIVEEFKAQTEGTVLYLETNAYPVKKIDHLFIKNGNDKEAIEYYEDLKEFRILLKEFFNRHQEESIPNQVKLMHNIDAKQILEQKRKFLELPLTSRWFKKLTGKGWSIYNYKKKI